MINLCVYHLLEYKKAKGMEYYGYFGSNLKT